MAENNYMLHCIRRRTNRKPIYIHVAKVDKSTNSFKLW